MALVRRLAVPRLLREARDRGWWDPLGERGAGAGNRASTLDGTSTATVIPSIDREAWDRLTLAVASSRRSTRPSPGERDMRRVLGGILIQDRDLEVEYRSDMQVVTEAQPESASGTTCSSPGGSRTSCTRTPSCS